MILVVDNYDSFTWNLVHLLQSTGEVVSVVRNDAQSIDSIPFTQPDGIVISPGPGNPLSAGRSLEIIRRFGPRFPILGVCLGHQCLAEAFGGTVIRAAEPMHGKTDAVYHDGRGLFNGLPSPFRVTRYHSLVVDHGDLPGCLRVTATTADGIIMALEHRDFPLHGIQFHPEAILTQYGDALVTNWAKLIRQNKALQAL